jgi:hypothetical protein
MLGRAARQGRPLLFVAFAGVTIKVHHFEVSRMLSKPQSQLTWGLYPFAN